MTRNLVIIGAGMASGRAIEHLLDAAPGDWTITLFNAEPRGNYNRLMLSPVLAGEKTYEQIVTHDDAFYTDNGIVCRFGEKVIAVDRARKVVVGEKGEVPYDKLVFGTGSNPFMIPLPGHDLKGVIPYRDLEDTERMMSLGARPGAKAVVIGGGLLGLEAAAGMAAQGVDVTVVHIMGHLMERQLDEAAGYLLKKSLETKGIKVLCRANSKEILADDQGHARALLLDDGTELPCDLLVMAVGIRPNVKLAQESGLAVGKGIHVDAQMVTSDPDILALGECVEFDGAIFGLVAPGYQMAKTAVATLTGGDICFSGADMSTKLKLLGVDVGSIGDAHGNQNPGARMFRHLDPLTQVYRKLVVTSDGKKLLGAMLVGDNSVYDTLLQYYANGIELPKEPASLILPQQSGAAPALGPDALPETAMICSCHNVTKGSICSAIDAGAADLGSVKGATKASTGCGGCAALLKSVVDHELEARGVEVDKSICEHFAHTRQGLYDIVRVEGIKTFSELMEKHGNAETHRLGCDICKPAVASILASCFNEPITDAAHVPLQDTNDTFMANMQKNGTYSVVPRIAGGEITPDKLVVLGQVAQKYQLYTKITGGQRIDLFGARLEDLPAIWGELIEAGFETGHAYGKSLRTVKSCVGSTWCRYGVQDSVGMAIQLENRYKGLRAPHKIKFGVSGCTRECAEAQSKDIGIIATENGWNLYVCGNGGMRPRHAELFATDLDDEQLYRTIDRFLMFYVRTADRLQRTSVWRENLEGGLDYLKEVILEDSLGINDELERQMQHVVDSYQCEWANAISDPEKLKRFRNFVNDARPDPSIIMTSERGQLRPA